MLTRPQVQRYSTESGLRDIMIAEKEVVLTFLLQLLSERGLLDRLAFKGGTCLRKMFTGSQGRFSTDLDFTGIEAHDHEDVILDMMQVFEQPFHGIQFSIPDEGYYETPRRPFLGRQSRLRPRVECRWQRDQAPDQPAGNPDATDRASPAAGAELFSTPAIRARGDRLPRSVRNHRREDPRLLPAKQGARHLRPWRVRRPAPRSASRA